MCGELGACSVSWEPHLVIARRNHGAITAHGALTARVEPQPQWFLHRNLDFLGSKCENEHLFALWAPKVENEHFFAFWAPKVKKRTLAHFGSIWAHLGPSLPPPGAAWAVDGCLGEDGEGGGKVLAGQPAVPDRGSAGLR